MKSSGAELPAAMKVAPATSSLRCKFYDRVKTISHYSSALSSFATTRAGGEGDNDRGEGKSEGVSE